MRLDLIDKQRLAAPVHDSCAFSQPFGPAVPWNAGRPAIFDLHWLHRMAEPAYLAADNAIRTAGVHYRRRRVAGAQPAAMETALVVIVGKGTLYSAQPDKRFTALVAFLLEFGWLLNRHRAFENAFFDGCFRGASNFELAF